MEARTTKIEIEIPEVPISAVSIRVTNSKRKTVKKSVKKTAKKSAVKKAVAKKKPRK